MYLLKQLFLYLDEYYFSASLGTYENFEIESVFALVVIIGGLCLGMIVASVVVFIQKRHIGKMVRRLLDLDAYSEENAKGLSELGVGKSPLIKMHLNGKTDLRKILAIKENGKTFTYLDELKEALENTEEKGEKGKKTSFRLRRINLDEAKFFIPEDAKDKAVARYGGKGSAWWTLPLAIFAITVLFFVLLRLTPFLVNMLDVTISNLNFL